MALIILLLSCMAQDNSIVAQNNLIPVEELTVEQLLKIKKECIDQESERIRQDITKKYSAGEIDYIFPSPDDGWVRVRKINGEQYSLRVNDPYYYYNYYKIKKQCEGVEGTENVGGLGEIQYDEIICTLVPNKNGKGMLLASMGSGRELTPTNFFIDYDAINACIFQKVDFSKSISLAAETLKTGPSKGVVDGEQLSKDSNLSHLSKDLLSSKRQIQSQ